MAQDKERVEPTTITPGAADELKALVDSYPRTDGMTLPAISVTEIDPETVARVDVISKIHNAENDGVVVDSEGRTVAQVRNLIEFGVADLDGNLPEGAGKHEVTTAEDGTVTIVSPNTEGDQKVVLKPTPRNISPMDVGAPTNPVEEKIALGLPEDATIAEVDRARMRGIMPDRPVDTTRRGTVNTPPPAPRAVTTPNPQPFSQPAAEEVVADENK